MQKEKEQERLKRGKLKRALVRMAKHLSCSEKELSLEREIFGYTNTVFKVTYRSKKYLYKEYSSNKEGNTYEIMWQKFFKFPKILFECSEYKIDEYIEHRHINRETVQEKEILIQLAKKLAQFHLLSPPSKNTKSYTEVLEYNRGKVYKSIKNKEFNEVCINIEKKILSFFEKSIFKNTFYLCHNDLQFGNILFLPSGKIELIDFEHVSLNYPTVEIANLFNEICTNYKKRGAPVIKNLVTPDLMQFFIQNYMKEINTSTNLDAFFREVERARPIPQYYWFLWAVNIYLTQKNTKEPLDYLAFAVCRLEILYEHGFLSAGNVKEVAKIIKAAGIKQK